MARNEALVTIVGWLNNVSDFDWGRALKVSTDVRKQNAAGEWETVDKTLFDVTTDLRDVNLEGVRQVEIEGRITGTNVFQKRDGTTGFTIKVRANHIAAVGEKVNHAAVHEVWPTVNPGQGKIEESAPF
jgi:hypothetical protein